MALRILLIVLSTLVLAGVAFYRRFVSPLARIPAIHPLASVTSLYMLWVRYSQRDNESAYLAHMRLGPIVRLGPNEISVNCVDEGIRTVYQSPAFHKTPFYNNLLNFGGIPNMVTSLDPHSHGARKKRVSNIYSKSYLQSSPDMAAIADMVLAQRLMPRLRQSARRATPEEEVMRLFQAIAMDMTTAYFFGSQNATNFVQDEKSHAEWLAPYHLSRTKSDSFYLMEMPNFTRRLMAVGINVLSSSRKHGNDIVDKWILGLCDKADATISEPMTQPKSPGHQPVVYAQLKKATAKDGLSTTRNIKLDWHSSLLDASDEKKEPVNVRSSQDLEIASELADHLIATVETFAITLTYLAWELSRCLDKQDRLRKELRSLGDNLNIGEGGGTDGMLPRAKEVDELPFLEAVLMETLRLHPAGAGPEPRYTPPGEVVKLAGVEGIPGGVRVQAYPWSMNRSPAAFPDPLGWHPERWLAGEEGDQWQGSEKKERWFWSFSSGARMCVGSNYALQVIKIIVAVIYANMHTYIIDDEGIEHSDGFIAGPKSNRLVLGFKEIPW